jgi:flagellar export protein FliJ
VAGFAFRLQKVFEYRQLEEDAAKNIYLEKQSVRVQAENELDEIDALRKNIVTDRADDLNARLALEYRLQKLDDNERACRLLIRHLIDEEELAKDEWLVKKREAGVIETLHDKARDEWQHEEDLKEQHALDEWATQRRRPAQRA